MTEVFWSPVFGGYASKPLQSPVLDTNEVLPKFGFSDSGELLRRVVRGVRDSRRRNLVVHVIVGEGGSVVGG